MSTEQEKPQGLKLGSIAGVPVYLAYSWFGITAIITIVMGLQLQRVVGITTLEAYALGLACAVVIAFAVLVHEVAHALVARAFKWPDAHIVLTLMGGHTQFGSFKATPGASLLVALAGPAANFVLAGLGWVIDTLYAPPTVPGLLLSFLIYSNVLLGIFNVLPGLPLDGGRLVETAVWKATGSQERGTIAAAWCGRVIAVLVVAGALLYPLWRGLSPELTTVVVAAMIALFMWQGAGQLISYSRMRLNLPRVRVRDLMSPASAMHATVTVAEVLSRRSSRGGQVVLLDPRGMPAGVVDEPALARVPSDVAANTPALSVCRALGEGAVVDADADGRTLIQYLAGVPTAEYVVIDAAGRVVGLLQQQAIIRAISGQ